MEIGVFLMDLDASGNQWGSGRQLQSRTQKQARLNDETLRHALADNRQWQLGRPLEQELKAFGGDESEKNICLKNVTEQEAGPMKT